MSSLDSSSEQMEKELLKLQGYADTELVEHDGTLRLVYRRESGDTGPGELVESQPNVMPLHKDGNIYTLGLESLLAYYGLYGDNTLGGIK